LNSDFLCPSQLLPFFSLYSLLMARLWRFGFLFCSSVSCFSSLRRHHCHPLRYPLRGRPFDRRSLPLWFILLRSPLPLPSRHPLFYVLCFMFYVLFWIGFLWCLYVLDYGFGMFVFGIAFMAAVYRHSSRPASILLALLLPHASSPSSSPPVSLLYRFSFVFSRRRLLRRSSPSPSSRDLHLSLGLRPSTFGSSSVVLVLVSRGISTVGGGYCHKCRS
jgi:hypothetical protein